MQMFVSLNHPRFHIEVAGSLFSQAASRLNQRETRIIPCEWGEGERHIGGEGERDRGRGRRERE